MNKLQEQQVKPKAVIFDIDSTLSDTSKRQHLAYEENWEEFYAAASDDDAFPQTVELTKFYKFEGYYVILLTGRPIALGTQLLDGWTKWGRI